MTSSSRGARITGPAPLVIPVFRRGNTRKNTEDFFVFSVFPALPRLKLLSVAGMMIEVTGPTVSLFRSRVIARVTVPRAA